MVLHYLKVALRNLLKYKTHSFISALCLAVGIVCYTIICFFMQEWAKLENLPDSERRIRITVNQKQSPFFRTNEIKRLEEQSISGLECLTIQSFNNSTEIEVIDNEQRNLPFLIGYRGVNSNFSPITTENCYMAADFPKHLMKWYYPINLQVKHTALQIPLEQPYALLTHKV